MHDQDAVWRAAESSGEPGDQAVAVLSAAVLSAARAECHVGLAEFAERAGVGLQVVRGAENGTLPVWALPYGTFTALCDAVSMLDPALRPVFETAAACDLVLTCVLRGDWAFATDVLAGDGTRDLAIALLRWAVTGQIQPLPAQGRRWVPAAHAWHETCGGRICPACGGCPCVSGVARCGHRGQLLTGLDLAELRRKASQLAASASPDAWVGADILAVLAETR